MLKEIIIAIVLIFIAGSITKYEKKSKELKEKKHQEILDAINNLKND